MPDKGRIVEKQWGLGRALKAKGSMIDETFRICSTDGKEQKRIDLRAKVEYGGDRVVYHRQDLHDVLKAKHNLKGGFRRTCNHPSF
jgi:salicylate hydroxylase